MIREPESNRDAASANRTQPTAGQPSTANPVGRLRFLQRTAGNLAVSRLLAPVVQRDPVRAPASSADPVVTLYRGTTHVWINGVSRTDHDLGDGWYLTRDGALALRYAAERREQAQQQHPGAVGVVLRVEATTSELGLLLDFHGDPALRTEWETFARTRGGAAGEWVLRGGPAQLYNGLFSIWVNERFGRPPQGFDTIIGPEYIRGGSQVCIHNSALRERLRARLTEVARLHDAPARHSDGTMSISGRPRETQTPGRPPISNTAQPRPVRRIVPAGRQLVIQWGADAATADNARLLAQGLSGNVRTTAVDDLSSGSLSHMGELHIVIHGQRIDPTTRSPAAVARVGGEGGTGQAVTPEQMANELVSWGWRGGRVQLGMCHSGVSSPHMRAYGTRLRDALLARNAPSEVISAVGRFTTLRANPLPRTVAAGRGFRARHTIPGQPAVEWGLPGSGVLHRPGAGFRVDPAYPTGPHPSPARLGTSTAAAANSTTPPRTLTGSGTMEPSARPPNRPSPSDVPVSRPLGESPAANRPKYDPVARAQSVEAAGMGAVMLLGGLMNLINKYTNDRQQNEANAVLDHARRDIYRHQAEHPYDGALVWFRFRQESHPDAVAGGPVMFAYHQIGYGRTEEEAMIDILLVQSSASATLGQHQHYIHQQAWIPPVQQSTPADYRVPFPQAGLVRPASGRSLPVRAISWDGGSFDNESTTSVNFTTDDDARLCLLAIPGEVMGHDIPVGSSPAAAGSVPTADLDPYNLLGDVHVAAVFPRTRGAMRILTTTPPISMARPILLDNISLVRFVEPQHLRRIPG